MNRAHLLAFLWLRWRLRLNQFRKAGTFNVVILVLFMVATASAAVGLTIAGFLVGFLAFPHASPGIRLIVWDGVIVAFLFFWLTGLMTDLQRSEALAIDKVLHLPVSPSGAFVVNYLSSLFGLTLIAFVPGMVGLILGEVCAGSAVMLLALPLLAAFLFSLTAVTYQFRGVVGSHHDEPTPKANSDRADDNRVRPSRASTEHAEHGAPVARWDSGRTELVEREVCGGPGGPGGQEDHIR